MYHACGNPECKHHAVMLKNDDVDAFHVINGDTETRTGRYEILCLRRHGYRSPRGAEWFLCELCHAERQKRSPEVLVIRNAKLTKIGPDGAEHDFTPEK